MKPFIKWVGGKSRLLEPIVKLAGPTPIRRYFEPFVGGGAVFFGLSERIGEAYLADSNAGLMALYCTVMVDLDGLRREVKKLEGVPYYSIRERYNDGLVELTATERSALLLALLALCFNGLHRENKSGGFNTPPGRDSKGRLYTLDRINWNNLEECGTALRGSVRSLGTGDWETSLSRRKVGAGDLVFLDPPYIDQFSDYGSSGFEYAQHLALGQRARELGKAGARVILCGSYCEGSLIAYGEPLQVVQNHGTFSAGKRQRVMEAFWVFGPERK